MPFDDWPAPEPEADLSLDAIWDAIQNFMRTRWTHVSSDVKTRAFRREADKIAILCPKFNFESQKTLFLDAHFWPSRIEVKGLYQTHHNATYTCRSKIDISYPNIGTNTKQLLSAADVIEQCELHCQPEIFAKEVATPLHLDLAARCTSTEAIANFLLYFGITPLYHTDTSNCFRVTDAKGRDIGIRAQVECRDGVINAEVVVFRRSFAVSSTESLGTFETGQQLYDILTNASVELKAKSTPARLASILHRLEQLL